MRDQLIQYVRLLFAGTPDSYDMQQEILQNTLDRYDDLIAQGKAPEAAYRLAISGIGDINEIVGNVQTQPSSSPAPVREQQEDPQDISKKKLMQAISITLYICCVIPVLVLGVEGNGVPGVCLMFVIIAAATVLMVLSSGSKEDPEEKEDDEPKPKDENATVIGSSETSVASDLFKDVSKSEVGKAVLLKGTDGYYRLVINQDILADEYYYTTYRDETVRIMHAEDFNDFIAKEAGKLKITYDSYELDYLKPQKINYDEFNQWYSDMMNSYSTQQ